MCSYCDAKMSDPTILRHIRSWLQNLITQLFLHSDDSETAFLLQLLIEYHHEQVNCQSVPSKSILSSLHIHA